MTLRLAKEKKDKEKRQRKAAAAAEAITRRAAQEHSAEFKGPLSSKNKENLQDIAHALQISLDGKKADLASRISQHLNAHPELEEDSCFGGLFTSRILQHKRPNPTANAPPNQRRCLVDIRNSSSVVPVHTISAPMFPTPNAAPS
jgi:hypothetical protein